MANNPGETPPDDFLAQILGFPEYAPGAEANFIGNEAPAAAMMLQLGSDDGSNHLGGDGGIGFGMGGGYGVGGDFPLGLRLEHGKGAFHDASGSRKRFHRHEGFDSRGSSVTSGFHSQPIESTIPAAPHPPAIKPRLRAWRGEATDPHSIAERLRRERISERIRALKELVPSVNKTDRAVMLDEIVDYVKFLRLQVKVLSMSRLGGAGAVSPLVTDIPISSTEEDGSDCLTTQPAWEKWSNDCTEQQVIKLMEENIGAAMQFLQSKALCIMPVSLASSIYLTQPPDTPTFVKHESNLTN